LRGGEAAEAIQAPLSLYGRITARNFCSIAPFSLSAQSTSKGPAMISVAHIQPIVALLAGILILIMPRLLNFIVAIYLIFVGVMGLGLFR
jgi:hypothetical protein